MEHLWSYILHACGVTDIDASSDDEKSVVTVDTWLTQAEVKMTFECQEVTSNGYTYPRSDFLVFCPRTYSTGLVHMDDGLSLWPVRRCEIYCRTI